VVEAVVEPQATQRVLLEVEAVVVVGVESPVLLTH
jgi:hypothetical protein